MKVRTWFDASVAAQNVDEAHDTAVSALVSIGPACPTRRRCTPRRSPLLLTAMQRSCAARTRRRSATRAPVGDGAVHDEPFQAIAVPASSTAMQKVAEPQPTLVTLPGRASIGNGAPHDVVRTVASPA